MRLLFTSLFFCAVALGCEEACCRNTLWNGSHCVPTDGIWMRDHSPCALRTKVDRFLEKSGLHNCYVLETRAALDIKCWKNGKLVAYVFQEQKADQAEQQRIEMY